MVIFFQIIKTIIILLLVISPVLNVIRIWKFNDKRKKRDRSFAYILIVIWSFVSILSVLVIPSISQKIEAIETERKKPLFKIEFYERTEMIAVTVESDTVNVTPIIDLLFKFEIPGEFTSFRISSKDEVKSIDVSHQFMASIDEITTAESIHIYANTLFPSGFFRIEIYFKPTQEYIIPGQEKSKNPKKYFPIMDLHDFSKVFYTWNYNGKLISDSYYLDLRILSYIKKDNENLLKSMRLEDINCDLSSPKFKIFIESLRTKYNDEWLYKSEYSRRNW